MAVTICPWCQSEIPQEDGQEPDKICPVCDNEIDGYRTLKVNIGGVDEEYDDDDEDEDDLDEEADIVAASEGRSSLDDDFAWDDVQSFRETNEELLLFEETVEKLLDEQEFVPECPQCREYMLETGEQLVASFNSRLPEALGEAILEQPVKLTMYMCPSCYAVQSFIAEADRLPIAKRLTKAQAVPAKPKRKGSKS